MRPRALLCAALVASLILAACELASDPNELNSRSASPHLLQRGKTPQLLVDGKVIRERRNMECIRVDRRNPIAVKRRNECQWNRLDT